MKDLFEFVLLMGGMVMIVILAVFMFLLFTPPGWVLLIVGAVLIAG